MLIFVSENEVVTLKGGWVFFLLYLHSQNRQLIDKVHGMGKERGSRATKKANKKLC